MNEHLCVVDTKKYDVSSGEQNKIFASIHFKQKVIPLGKLRICSYIIENKHVHESAFDPFVASTTLSHEGTFFSTKANHGKNLFGAKVRLF